MSTEHYFIVTAQPEFAAAAIAELQQLERQVVMQEELAPGICLCTTPDTTTFIQKILQNKPVFIRHLAPVQATVALTSTERDISKLALTIAELPTFELLERGVRFAVQTRITQSEKSTKERPYSSGKINQSLAEAFAEETGAIESIKKPQIVISILCTSHQAYAGISTAEENLSSWPGGARHYAQTAEQISRAEFKLLEALETFGIVLPEHGRALDLGAAPGGWTRLLLEAGLDVVAVDPANLDPRLNNQSHLRHYRGYAEQYIEEASKKHLKFDLIVNDMRMDARNAARLLVQAAPCLKTDGVIISVLKLPHETEEIQPLKTFKEALKIVQACYDIVQAHQLFHNRQEVTIVAARPRVVKR